MHFRTTLLISISIAAISAAPLPYPHENTPGPQWGARPAPGSTWPAWSNQPQPQPQPQPYPNQPQPYPNQPNPWPTQPQSQPQPNPWPTQPQPQSQPNPGPSQPQPYPNQPVPAPQNGKGQTSKNKPYIENDASGLTLNGPLGTYHKGPDGTFIQGFGGTIDAQKGAPASVQGALGTVTAGQNGVKYEPKKANKGGQNTVVRNILRFLGVNKEEDE